VPITFNKTSQQELPCVFSTIVPLCFIKRIRDFCVLTLLLITFSSVTYASEAVVLRDSFAGNLSFELAGNSLRSTNNTCRAVQGRSSSSTITLPSSSTIKSAYLYWSGSGSTDSTATFNNQTVNADISYIETFEGNDYFSSKAEITNLVSNSTSTTYTVSGVTFDGSDTYCDTAGAYAGWAMVVVYENDSEPLRVINLFDGFKSFWGSDFDLTPSNFVIASDPSTKGGKHAHITWEGDSGNSTSKNSHTESLKFEGYNLTDNDNPSENQFNSYSNVQGTTSGVDIDEYDIGSYLTAGDTSVTTNYSTGQDAVFLTAEIISVPNEAVAELSLQQVGPTSLIRDQENSFAFTVTNNGPSNATSNTQVILTLPTGFTMESFAGTPWSCAVVADEISCDYSNDIAKDNSSTSLILTLKPGSSASNSVTISATVTGVEFDNILSNNTTSETYNIISSDLSSSQKIVTDVNGGNVRAGDILRYQIDISESNGISASGITLVDHLPTNISSFDIISIPSGAIDNSQLAPAGDNASGLISISNISIAANATESIIIDATIDTSATENTAIKNTATIGGSISSEVDIESATVYISKPADPATGNKPLYLRQTSNLSRIQPTSSAYHTLADLAEKTYVITPEFQQEFQFSDTTVNAYLFLQNNDTYGTWDHTITVELVHNTDTIGSVENTISIPSQGITVDNVALFQFAIPLSSTPTIAAGDTLSLKILNDSYYSQDSLFIYSIDPNVNSSDTVSPYSLVSLPAATVINIDDISILDSTGSQQITEASPSDEIIIQAEVSDPFGSFDISSANISIEDSQGTNLINQQSMVMSSDSGNAIKTFQYSYSIPANAELGDWSISITALEGVENEIDHTSESILKVTAALPEINVSKTVEVYSDPVHGTNSASSYAKAFPGAILTYTVTAENIGEGVAQDDSIWISDSVPANTYMLVTDYDGVSGQGPVKDETATSSNGLSYTFIALNDDTDDIEFSNNGTDFNYSPTEDGEGLDKSITHFRINPKGIFQAPAAGESSTEFTIKFRVQLQ
jgi:uncharacterized repeat protein (TIGR01451 family)